MVFVLFVVDSVDGAFAVCGHFTYQLNIANKLIRFYRPYGYLRKRESERRLPIQCICEQYRRMTQFEGLFSLLSVRNGKRPPTSLRTSSYRALNHCLPSERGIGCRYGQNPPLFCPPLWFVLSIPFSHSKHPCPVLRTYTCKPVWALRNFVARRPTENFLYSDDTGGSLRPYLLEKGRRKSRAWEPLPPFHSMFATHMATML